MEVAEAMAARDGAYDVDADYQLEFPWQETAPMEPLGSKRTLVLPAGWPPDRAHPESCRRPASLPSRPRALPQSVRGLPANIATWF